MKLPRMQAKAAAGLALALFAGAAAAQSNVTLFGVADAAFRRANTENNGGISSLVSGAYSSSRWGMRGVEDLGGGYTASFWLESFLSQDTGLTTPDGFQRRSTVSFAHRDFGELRAGRDYVPTHSSWSRMDPFQYVGIGSVQLYSLAATGNTPATAAFGTNPNSIQRASNGLAFFLPRNSFGLEGHALYTFQENGTAANDAHKVAGGRLGWTGGKFFINAAYVRTTDSVTRDRFEDEVLAAAYDFGVARVSGGIRRFEYLDARQNNYLLAAVVPLGVHELKASWNRADMAGRVGATRIDNDRSDQFAIGYVYNFSKTTRLYTTFATIRNHGNARFVVPGAPRATANGQDSRGFEAGINKEF